MQASKATIDIDVSLNSSWIFTRALSMPNDSSLAILASGKGAEMVTASPVLRLRLTRTETEGNSSTRVVFKTSA